MLCCVIHHRKNTFRAHILHFEPGTVCFSLREHSKLQRVGQKLQDMASSSFFRWETPPPLCLPYLGRHGRHLRDVMDQAFPLRFCILQVIKK